MNQGDNNGGAVAGSFTMQAQLPNGKSLTFSGYVLQGEALADINAKLDVASAVVERQRKIAEIPVLEADLDQKLRQKTHMESHLIELQGKDKLTSQEKQLINTYTVSLKNSDEDIAKGVKAITEARRELAA